MTASRDSFDVVIVGARPAGAATAMLLARGGVSVLLVEKAPMLGDTMSTHALMRPAVALLEQWGLAAPLVAAGTAVVDRTTFQYGQDRVTIPLKPIGSVPGLISPRRWLLDPMLAEAAVRAGAELRLATSFEGVIQDASGQVTGVTLRSAGTEANTVSCRLLIGADGRVSKVADAVRAPYLSRTRRGAASIYGYFPDIPNEGYRWMFSPALQAGLIPTTNGMHCVFASCPHRHYRDRFGRDALSGLIDAIATTDPAVACRLAETKPDGRLVRFTGAEGHIRAAAGAGWALVGDAGYFKDPATAHGLSDALLDAHRLAHAILTKGHLSEYVRQRNAHAFEFLYLTERVGALDWSLDELKQYHTRVSEIMSAENAEIAHWNDRRLAA